MLEASVPARKNLTREVRRKKARLMKAQHKDPKFRKKFLASLHEYNADPEMKRKKAKMLKDLQKSPAFEKKRKAGFERYLRRLRRTKKTKR